MRPSSILKGLENPEEMAALVAFIATPHASALTSRAAGQPWCSALHRMKALNGVADKI
jgi:hypothetical protein